MSIGFMSDARLTSAKETFLLDCKAADLSKKTLRGYRDVLTKFIQFTGEMTVQDLKPDHVRTYIAYLSERPGRYGEFSSHSLAKHYAVIRVWIRWLYAQKMITERITDNVKPPRLSQRVPQILTTEELDDLFTDLKKKKRFRDLVIFELFWDTGLRLQEVASLTIDDVNIDGGWIHVIGKGDKEDVVPIGAQVCRDLFAYINMHRKPALEQERAVFLSDHGPTRGYALGYEGLAIMVRRELSRIRKVKGKRGAHIMRHTAGTDMIRGGASVEHVRRVLRQNDTRVTQIYLHLANEDLLAAHRTASPVDRAKTKSPRRR